MEASNNNYYTYNGDKFKPIPSFDNKTASLIKENEVRIEVINNRIKEYEKNPNFYRNKKIIAVAAIVALVAIAMFAYFYVATPILIGAIAIGHYSSYAAAAVAILAPFLFAAGGISGVANLFKSFDKDNKTLGELVKENRPLKDKIQKDIKLCEYFIDRSNATIAGGLAEKCNEDRWQAMKDISTTDYSIQLDSIIINKAKEEIWRNNQRDIKMFKFNNKMAKLDLEALLRSVSK